QAMSYNMVNILEKHLCPSALQTLHSSSYSLWPFSWQRESSLSLLLIMSPPVDNGLNILLQLTHITIDSMEQAVSTKHNKEFWDHEFMLFCYILKLLDKDALSFISTLPDTFLISPIYSVCLLTLPILSPAKLLAIQLFIRPIRSSAFGLVLRSLIYLDLSFVRGE
ncbi:hypothetical protein STEG23_023174, partial [Scotinomys teguina]